ncbi:Uncharacterised protein [Burkholderia cenocepacia]|nr:Uncharacterised protein [Burkholderia cenocepacia]
MRMSPNTASSCAVTKAASGACTPVTPRVFCAVSAVITLAPYAPSAENVFRSA